MVDDNDSDPLGMLDAAMEAELAQPDIIPEPEAGGDGERARNIAAVLAQMARQYFTFVTDQNGTVLADYMEGKLRKTVPLMSDAFKNIMRRRYGAMTNGSVAKDDALTAVQKYLAALAEEGAQTVVSGMRRLKYDGKIYIDLCNESWEVIEIDAEGWRVGAAPDGIRFRRSAAMRPLPKPISGGSLADFKRVINFQDDKGPIIVMMWLLAAISDGPYAILNITGPDGSAKSSATEFTASIIDPSKFTKMMRPRKLEDYIINCLHCFAQRYDNLSKVTPEEWDIICGIATGTAMSGRQLFSDAELAAFAAMAPFIMNGIANLAMRRDVASRTLPLALEPPSDEARKTDEDMKALFKELHPKLLGFVCEVAHKGLANMPGITVGSLPRMADNAKWFHACADAFIDGGRPRLNEILKSLDDDLAAANIENDPFARLAITIIKEAERRAVLEKAAIGSEDSSEGMVIDRGEDSRPRYVWMIQAKELFKIVVMKSEQLNRERELVRQGSVPIAANRMKAYFDQISTAMRKGGIDLRITYPQNKATYRFTWDEADRYGVAYPF